MPDETKPLEGLEFMFEDGPGIDILGDDGEEGQEPKLPIAAIEDIDIFKTNPNDDSEDEDDDDDTGGQPAAQGAEHVDDEDDDDDEASETSPEEQLAGLANYFGKIGLFKVKEGEDFSKVKWTEESFIEKFQETKKQGALEELERIVSERMGEQGADFIQKVFVNGMPYQAYLNSFAQEKSYERLDPENEKHAEQIISAYLESRGLDEEEIGTQVAFLKENSLLAKKAEKFKSLLVEDEKTAREEYDAQIKERQKQFQEREQQRLDTYTETVKEAVKAGNILGVPVTATESKALIQFVTDKPHVLQNGQKLTDFEYKLAKMRVEDPTKFLAVAKILMDDVDLTKITKAKKTEETNSLYNELKLGKQKKSNTGKATPNIDFLLT